MNKTQNCQGRSQKFHKMIVASRPHVTFVLGDMDVNNLVNHQTHYTIHILKLVLQIPLMSNFW